MRSNRPQIMIADDHACVPDACRNLLEPECDVVATVGDGRALYTQWQSGDAEELSSRRRSQTRTKRRRR